MSAPSRIGLGRGERRRPFVAVCLVAALAVLGIVSATSSPAIPPAATNSAAFVGLHAESSASFCSGLEYVRGIISSEVTVADLTSTRRTLQVTVTNELNRAARRFVALRPGHVVHLDPVNLLHGTLESMSIVANGGGFAATEAVGGVNGTAVAPCLTSTSSSSYLTGGSTERGSSYRVFVFNPFASTAQVSVDFDTPSGSVTPLPYQGLVLGPHQEVTLKVHDVSPNESPISTHVTTAQGSVVVYGVGRSTTGGPTIWLLPGAPAPATVSSIPVSTNSSTTTTSLVLSNPSPTAIAVTVSPVWSPGCAAGCATPFTLTLGGYATTSLQIAPTAHGVVTAAEVHAAAPGVVLVQRVTSSVSLGQSAPVDAAGTEGASQVALVDPIASSFDEVGIVNPGGSPVTVTLETEGPNATRVEGTVTIPADRRVGLPGARLHWLVGGVLELVATGPISASAVIHGALQGSNVLPAVPAG